MKPFLLEQQPSAALPHISDRAVDSEDIASPSPTSSSGQFSSRNSRTHHLHLRGLLALLAKPIAHNSMHVNRYDVSMRKGQILGCHKPVNMWNMGKNSTFDAKSGCGSGSWARIWSWGLRKNAALIRRVTVSAAPFRRVAASFGRATRFRCSAQAGLPV